MNLRVWFIIVVLLFGSTSHAFDGKRKGFVLGGGIGFAPWAKYARPTKDVHNSSVATGLNFEIGKGLSERNQFYLDYRLVAREAKGISDLTVGQGFLGVVWRWYCVSATEPLFTTLGFGRVALVTMDSRRDHSTFDPVLYDNWMSAGSGWGYTIGVGYQVRKHIDLSANYSSGGFEADGGGHTSVNQLDLSATLMLF